MPYEALDEARTPEERLLVVYLYEEAHRRRWAPSSRTIRQLADASGVKRQSVARLIDRLEAAGLVMKHVQMAGKRRDGLRLVVLDPQVSELGHQAGHGRDTANEEQPSESAGSGTRLGHQAGHALRDARADPDPDQRLVEEEDHRARARLDSTAVAEAMAELLQLQQANEPQHGMHQPKDRAALERALLRGTSLEALRSLWQWSGESDDGQAAACRDQNWRRWSSLLKQPLGEERLELAEAWQRRQHAARAPPAPEPEPEEPRLPPATPPTLRKF